MQQRLEFERGFVVATLHYVYSDWKMRTVTITFIRVLYLHMATRFAIHLIQAFPISTVNYLDLHGRLPQIISAQTLSRLQLCKCT